MARTKAKPQRTAVTRPDPPNEQEVDELETPPASPIIPSIAALGSRPSSPQHSQQSSSSTTSSSHSISLNEEILLALAYSLCSIDALGTLSTLTQASKATHVLLCPVLFHDITIRNHRQLTAILSSLEVPNLDVTKRRTRLSAPGCDTQAKLARFRLTKHLSINHFPSLANLARLSFLQDTYSTSPIFESVHSFHIAPIFVHYLHPAVCGKPTMIAATTKRVKDAHLLRILARPDHLTIDMREPEEEWHTSLSSDTTHGCTCIDDFCGRLEESWTAGRKLKETTVLLDLETLSTHFYSSSAQGPHIRLVLSPPPPEQLSRSTSPSSAQRARLSDSNTPTSDVMVLEALAKFMLHRVRIAREYRGGTMTIAVPKGHDGSKPDCISLKQDMVSGAKEMLEDGEEDLFSQARARCMVKALLVKTAEET